MADPGRSRPSVLVLGSLNVDVVTRVRSHPAPGETVRGEGLRHLPGGKGANQAVAAAAAGVAVAMVGRVGDDAEGERYRAELQARGVDVSHVRTAPGTPTGHALIVVDAVGENTIVVVAGANGCVQPDDVDAALDATSPDVLLAQLEVPGDVVAHAARRARERGVRLVLNASPVGVVPAEVLAVSDPVVVNEHEARVLVAGVGGATDPESLVRTLLDMGVPSVVLTLGARGALYADGGRVVHEQAPGVDVVDTTGAGDAFAGALAAALASGHDLPEALRRAVAAGSEATTWHGAQGWAL